jgi:NitT/TauT family transport system substrate-binding protein
MKVAALPLVDAAALYVGQKQGYFKAEGLNVQIVPIQQSILTLPALQNGQVDAVDGNYVTFLQANDKGQLKLRILAEGATLTSNVFDVLALPKTGIRSPKDLEGKKIAVNILNNIQSLTLNQILKADNVDISKVTYVQIPFPQMAAALQSGQVQAVHMGEPFITDTQEKIGAKIVVDGGGAPVTNLPVSGYESTEAFVKKYPKTAAAFQRGMFKAAQAITANRKLAEEVLPTYAHITPQLASVITLPGFPTSNNATRMQRLGDLMLDAQLLTKKADMASILLNPTNS